jgi:1-acyl-sn-glycerol-3-phosphate acyltransferase
VKSAALGAYTYAEFGAFLLGLLPFIAASHVRHRHDETPRLPGRWLRRLGRWSSSLTPLWQFSVEGQAPADIASRPYVVVANHESTADPFLLSHLPWDMRWVAKEELFRPPVTGWYMRLSGDIPLRRGERESVQEMLAECKRTLAAGLSVMIFPEGTRSKDAELLPFKDGAFQLAIEANVPVLPIALYGTHACRPKGSRWFGRARAVARVLDPIETSTMTLTDVAMLRELARGQIRDAVLALRARPDLGLKPSAPKPPSPPIASRSHHPQSQEHVASL